MAMRAVASKANNILLGVCIPCLRYNAAKISVQKMELDEKLLMFFKKKTVVFAHDPDKICKTGDIVLIEELPKRMSTSITHKVLEVVFEHGDVSDPITGEKVVGKIYRSQYDKNILNYGQIKDGFDYKKAPKRGWQEGKKDFSHRDIYYKYHEFDEEDENRDQPDSTIY